MSEPGRDCKGAPEATDGSPAARVRPWTRCAVCGFRKWTHWTFRRGDEGRTFYTTRKRRHHPRGG